MPSDQQFSDPGGPKFKIVEPAPAPRDGMTDEDARRWLEQPVTQQPQPRTISEQEVAS